MTKRNIYKQKHTLDSMKKRGEVTVVVAIVSLVIVTGSILAGSYFLTNDSLSFSLEEANYVGDVDSKQFYSINCIEKVPEQNRIIFKEKNQAEQLEFYFMTECPK